MFKIGIASFVDGKLDIKTTFIIIKNGGKGYEKVNYSFIINFISSRRM